MEITILLYYCIYYTILLYILFNRVPVVIYFLLKLYPDFIKIKCLANK